LHDHLELLDAPGVESQYPDLNARSLRYLRSTGRLTYYLVCGRARYSREDIEAFLRSCRVEAKGSWR
jgi:hypothetical protein